MCQDRINNLVDNFNNYLNIFSERNQLCGPSIYFHNRIMGILRETTLSSLQNQLWFSEYIYAVLVSWGMHRMDRGAQLKDFPVFHRDRKSTRLNSSHLGISYAVFCLKK